MSSLPEYNLGKVIAGEASQLESLYNQFREIPIDLEMLNNGPYPFSMKQTTIAEESSVQGPGTFLGSETRTLTFVPSQKEGWWIDRIDQKEQFPIKVSVRNVWTTARNIVLRSGCPHNYLRMVEHIIAMRIGMGLDNLTIKTDSGDPPLFDRGNLDIVEAIEKSKIVETEEPAKFVTVKEPVTFIGSRGDFLTFIPAKPGEYGIRVDCAINFKSAIGTQRILFDVTPETFRIGAEARTNAPYSMYLYSKTVGKLFADTRNLGYTTKNILIHKKKQYFNEPKLIYGDKSLEPVWHRATLDLLAAVALIDTGRFAGTIVSYKAGHTQDVRMAGLMYLKNYIVEHK